jgi:AraC-like DNA-binding protein
MFLLDARQIPLEEVAERIGYSTLSNFVRAFRQWTGRTPAEYRRSRSALGFCARGPRDDRERAS